LSLVNIPKLQFLLKPFGEFKCLMFAEDSPWSTLLKHLWTSPKLPLLYLFDYCFVSCAPAVPWDSVRQPATATLSPAAFPDPAFLFYPDKLLGYFIKSCLLFS
jgi:hypothetical protein